MPQRLLLASTTVYAAVFLLVIAFGRPGLGVGGGFYLAVVLAALASDGKTGALAGLLGVALYDFAEILAGREGWGDVLSAGSLIRLTTYVLAGVAAGLYATRARGLLAQSFHVLDDVLALAKDAAERRAD